MTFTFKLAQVVEVDTVNQQITIVGSTKMIWRNEFLQWNPKQWDDINILKIDPATVWIPDIMVWGRYDKSFGESIDGCEKLLFLFNNGTMIWSCPAMYKSMCYIDVTYFPFDRQSCELKYAPWTLDQTELSLKHDNASNIAGGYIPSGEWSRPSVKMTGGTFPMSSLRNQISQVVITITLERRSLYYLVNILVPCLMLMVVILIGFHLPPESGERISLVITVLLAFTVYLQMVSSSLPKTSQATPLISTFYIVVMAESVFSLILTCLVLIIHNYGYGAMITPVPEWARKYIIETVGKKIITSKPKAHGNSLTGITSENDNALDSPKSEKMCLSDKEGAGSLRRRHAEEDKLLKEINVITSAIREQRSEGEVGVEWKCLAEVLDRLFFWMFVLLFTVTPLSIFLPIFTTDSPNLRLRS